ncbi:MAG: hypothetical protein ACE5ES_03505, partial [Candidatus Nanoarchaeia archaeon]
MDLYSRLNEDPVSSVSESLDGNLEEDSEDIRDFFRGLPGNLLSKRYRSLFYTFVFSLCFLAFYRTNNGRRAMDEFKDRVSPLQTEASRGDFRGQLLSPLENVARGRIAFIGDSLSITGTGGGVSRTLPRQMRARGYEVAPLAQLDATSRCFYFTEESVRKNLQYLLYGDENLSPCVSRQLEEAKRLNPNYIVLWTGNVDLMKRLPALDGWRAVADSSTKEGTRLICMTIPHWAKGKEEQEYHDLYERREELNEYIRQ